jgi:hypothetical protein
MGNQNSESEADNEKGPSKRELSHKRVIKYLNANNICVTVGGTFKISEAVSMSLKDMGARIWHEYSGSLGKDHYTEALKIVRNLAIQNMYDKVRRKIIVEPHATNDAMLRAALRTLIHPSTTEEKFEYYVAAIKQLIWQVKQKFLGRRTKWDIFVVLYSKEGGTGKTTWAHNFGRCLNDYFMEDASIDIFMDKFRQGLLSARYLAFIDEMQDADSREMKAIKNTITKSRVQGRGMYSEDEFDRPRNASFIACSNKHLTEHIQDESMRRWVEIECNEQRIAHDAARSAAANAIDWPAVWAAIGHDDESPYAQNLNLFEKAQSELVTETTFDMIAYDRFCEKQGATLRNLTAYQAYLDVARSGRPLSIQRFAREMKRKFKWHKVDNAVVYEDIEVIPI